MKNEKRINLIISTASTIILWALVALCFDFFYELNDDILIKDIVAGIYTGIPEAHNNQMMYPISLLLSMIYKVFPKIAWFGLFEIAGFLVCFYMITYRMIAIIRRVYIKAILAVGLILIWMGLYAWELSIMQYTVLAGTMCASACVWLYLNETTQDVKAMLCKNIPAIVLVLIAFNIRSEMCLLMVPYMGIAAIGRIIDEECKTSETVHINAKGICAKYVSICAVIAIGVLITYIADIAAYSSDEWKNYREVFDARTDVYDFTGIPPYDENASFYESIDVDINKYNLLCNYNYALDDSIDADTLNAIAMYVHSGNASKAMGAPKSIKTTVSQYVKDFVKLRMEDADISSPFADDINQLMPFNIVIMLLYVSLILIAIVMKNKWLAIKVISAAIVRSVPWIYVYMKGRLVTRITHPMLMCEVMLLLAILIYECVKGTKVYLYLTLALLMGISIINISGQYTNICMKQEIRDNKNVLARQLSEYVSSNDGYFYVDVYSTVSMTERVFDKEIDKSRWQLAGGWMACSPLDSNKKHSAGVDEDMRQFNFISEEEDIAWLTKWYKSKYGKDARVDVGEVIVGTNNEHLYVYRIGEDNGTATT